MQSAAKLTELLRGQFGNTVSAKEQNGILYLSGHLPDWDSVVAAGRLCADPKSRRMLVNDITAAGCDRAKMQVPTQKDEVLKDASPDVLVIGAGVVGCAIARELARYELKVLLVEKEHDVAMQASSRNDGMVHPGIDLKPWQVKQKYNLAGNRMYPEVCRELEVPFARTGQIIGVTQSWGKAFLPLSVHYWRRMGIPCNYLSRQALLQKEPHLSQDVVCGLEFPTAGIVCPYGLTIAYAENAVQNGVQLSLDTAVLGMELQNGNICAVHTNRGTVYPRVVVNAAGVFSEEIAKMAEDRFFSIHPRRGTNAIVDKKAAFRVQTIASLLGTAATKSAHSKGGGLVRTVDGNLLVGPDAVETPAKEDYATTAESVHATFAKQKNALPELSEADIITYFTGVRAATYEEDFVICKGRATHNLVHAAGIQSPGLTAAPAIGVEVAKMAAELAGITQKNPRFDPHRTAIPRVAELPKAERNALIHENPDFGVIVCRCEEVSRGEILAALHRAVPCDTVDGVKRRVRPGMGRCQGGFCGPLVTQIIAQELHKPLEQVCKSGEGSELLLAPTKAEALPGSFSEEGLR